MHVPLSDQVLGYQNVSALKLRKSLLLGNLRRARRGAAPGPSGITAEHLRPILDSEEDSRLLVNLCNQLANANIPGKVLQVIALDRLTALRKPAGEPRGTEELYVEIYFAE